MNIWEELDLSRHAVIEASAGTGKTYALERIVARLLTTEFPPGSGEFLSIDKLLVVTFTEKAAGELKDRLRKIISEKLAGAKQEDEKTLLRNAMDNFDTASISTIHGFCRRVLREFAFENRQAMDLKVFDGAELALGAVRRVLRSDAPMHFKERYKAALKNACGKNSMDDCINGLTELLQEYKGEPCDALAEEWAGQDIVGEFAQQIRTAKEELNAILKGEDLSKSYERLNFNKRSRDAALKTIEAIQKWLKSRDVEAQQAIDNFSIMFSKLREDKWLNDSTSFDFERLQPKTWIQNFDNTQAVFPAFPAFMDALRNGAFKNTFALNAKYRNELNVFVVQEAFKTLEDEKNKQGLITFDDMIRRVWRALNPKTNGNAQILLDAIQQRYKVALVDEFQDTDLLQWEVLSRLFVEDAGARRLIVVGDPKQAIYAFRGADVKTYLQARKHLIDAEKAKVYSLDQTWRCVPELVKVFNQVFKGDHWFPGAGDGINYSDVSSPENIEDKIAVAQDKTGRKALIQAQLNTDDEVKEIEDKETKEKKLKTITSVPVLRSRCSGFIVNEIARLLNAKQPLFRFKDSKNPDSSFRPLAAGDICVLVQAKKNSNLIEKGLKKRGIPYTFYKKPGLYQSDEALHLSVMLEFLANPRNEAAMAKALLTRFYAASVAEIENHAGFADRKLQRQMDSWQMLCEKRQWGKLFDSLMYDTGLWHREAAQPDGDRRLSNFRQIFEELIEASAGTAFDAAGLLSLLRARQQDSKEAEVDGDLHQKETEQPKVQIMTMHAAKGLEFPIVFIALPSAPSQKIPWRLCFDACKDNKPVRLISFDAGDKEKKKNAKALALKELKQLYYVAFTRAQYKLYVPWLTHLSEKLTVMDQLVLPGFKKIPSDADYVSKVLFTENDIKKFSDANNDQAGPCRVGEGNVASNSESILKLYKAPSLSGRRVFLDSFSSLHRRKLGSAVEEQPAMNSFADAKEQQDDALAQDQEADDFPQQAPEHRIPFAPLLPKGAKSGEVFHEIMESLCLAQNSRPGFESIAKLENFEAMLDEKEIMALIDKAMARRRLKNRQRFGRQNKEHLFWETRRELAVMVWRALRTELNGAGVCLGKISPADRRAELEFYMSERNGFSREQGHATAHDRKGIMTGFIDLIFRHNGKYYIVDWKTNSLDAYTTEAVNAVMMEANYHLQYQIYTLAVLEWLRISKEDFSDEQFGGVFYLFVRAGANDPDASPGIFYEQWSANKEKEYQNIVRKNLGNESRTRDDDSDRETEGDDL